MNSGKPTRLELRSETDDLVFALSPQPTQTVDWVHDDRSIDELIEATNPRAVFDERMAIALDVQAASAPEGSDDRSACIEDRFRSLEYMFRLRSSSGHSESVTAVVAFLALATTATALVARSTTAPWWTWIALASALLWPLLIYRMIATTKHVGWRAVEPHLVESLLWIGPSEEELRVAISQLRRAGLRISKAASAKAIALKLQEVRVGGKAMAPHGHDRVTQNLE